MSGDVPASHLSSNRRSAGDSLARVGELVRQYRSDMVELVQRLIIVPTENPPGNHYRECVEVLCRHLVDLGFEPEIIGDCVLCFLGKPGPTLYLSGHYDVVPAQRATQFQPSVRGNTIVGRGASDMKGGLAAMIYAAVAVRETGGDLNGRIGLVFVPDEETAGPRGSRFLAQQGLLGRDGIGMLTPEPTDGVIWNASRGAITLRVTVRGKSSHVGRQFDGVNAFEGMIALVQELSSVKREVETRVTAYSIHPDDARRSILMLGGETMGGTNFNVVPDRCWFTIDRRINPEEDLAAERARLLSLLEKRRDPWTVEVEVLQEGSSARVSEDTPLGVALRESIRSVTEAEPRFEMCPGLLECRFYAERGMPAYAYGPGLLTVSHGPDELVPIDNIVDCAATYALTCLQLLGG